MNFNLLSIVFSVCLLISPTVFAQELLPWKKDIKIDADFVDWKEDSLRYFYDEQGLKYAISNDDSYLYIFIKVAHQGQQLKAIYNGFNITISESPKEESGSSVIFPLPDKAALQAVNEETNFEKAANRRQFGLETIRAIYVRGFDGIVDGMISIRNTYGVKPAIRIDSSDVLNYELAIPLNKLKIDTNTSFAINLRINEIITTRYTDPGFRRYRYGYPYYGRSPYGLTRPRSGISRKEVPGAWHTVKLASHSSQ